MRFTLAVSVHFTLWISISHIVNYFQKTIRDPKDDVCMFFPPNYIEWFTHAYPNDAVTLDDGRLVFQLINGCQVSTYVVRSYNQNFDRVLGKLGLNGSMRDLAVRASKVYGDLVILNVSTEDALVRTKLPIIR